jgi:hypothetical protein
MRAGFGIAVLALLPYAWAPVYRFPEPAPFSGARLFNPYETLHGTWQRANLHAHGRAWGGLTSGEQSDEAVARRYRELGYAVAGVSDYQRIASHHGVDTLPLYEHGFNVGKNHQLAIGAQAVDWFDLPFWQTRSNQQYVIDRLRRNAALVSLNHPSSREAYEVEAVSALTGYDLIEVVNGPFTAEDVWDAALSSGRSVWAVANDDTHDLNDPRRTAVGWNMIDATSASPDAIVNALGAGRSYAVLRTGALEAADITTLSSLRVHDHTVSVTIAGAPSTISFVGQNGALRYSAEDVHSASYTLTDHDPYIRTVVTSPQTVLYLNPVIRWDGARLPEPAATVDQAWTWTQRGGIAVGAVLLVWRLRARRTAGARVTARRVVARRA